MVRKSTLILAVAAAFCAGLFGGHLAATISMEAGPAVTKQVIGNSAPVDNAERARLELAVKNSPQNVEAWNNLGHWYFDNNLPKEAVKAYESSLVLKPGDPNIMTDLGVMYRALHEHDKALDMFRKASAANPNHMQSRFNQGIVLFYDLNRPDEAIAVWTELVRKDPDYKAPNGQKLADWVAEHKKNR